MGDQENRKAYAVSFVSYLLKNIDHASIDNIILYGSVAKNQSTKESDVDIFVNVKKETEKTNKNIREIADGFYSSKEAIIFKLLGVDSDINLMIGKLDDWVDLKRSILSDGILLWGKYEEKTKPSDTEHKVIFFWEGVGKNRTAFLNKLYGYKTKKIEVKGVLGKWGAQKLGKSCVILPIKHREEMIEILKKYRVNAKVIEVFC